MVFKLIFKLKISDSIISSNSNDKGRFKDESEYMNSQYK